MTYRPLKHVVFVTGPGWTHVRPGLKFMALLVEKFPNLFVSVYTLDLLAEQSNKYLAAHSSSVRERVRIVPSMTETQLQMPLDMFANMERTFGPWISRQVNNSSMEINSLVVGPPSCIIEDHIGGGVALASKDVHQLPIVSWWVATAASFMAHIGNAEHGHGGRWYDSIGAALGNQKPGAERSTDEIVRQELTDRLVCVPGLPPYYEHEVMPHPVSHLLAQLDGIHKGMNRMKEHMTMAVFSSTYEMEPIAAEAAANAFSQPIVPFCVGPPVDLPPPGFPTLSPTFLGLGASVSDPVLSFFNRAYADLGAHSVVYIAFGTHFFPSLESAPHMKILIEEILAHGLRLVFAIRPDSASTGGLSAEYLGKLSKQGNAIFPEWTKQLEVLEHPALHYFVSHGGWNSTTEALVRNVPMIFWPIAGDQPTNALQIARQQDCGFELLQIRTGAAKSVAYGRDGDIPIVGSDEAVRDEVRRVLAMSRGARGKQQRLNVKALGKVLRDSLAKGGSGDLALERFGRAIGL